MAINAGPDIIEDGLVLCLDAANINSYPKSGTTWSDLVGTNDGTLANMDAANFSSDNAGSFNFDGTNDYVDFGDISFIEAADCTISFAAKVNSTGTDQDFVTKGLHNSRNPFIVWYDASAGNSPSVGAGSTHCLTVLVRGSNSASMIWISSPTNSITSGEICMFDVVIDTTNKKVICYKNGSLLMESAVNSSFTGIKNSTSPLRLGVDANTAKDLNGSFFYFRAYNKVLTSDEIRQNYEATVGRFT